MIFMFASNIGLTLKSYDAILVFILPQKEHAFKFYKVHLYLTELSFRHILAVFAMWKHNLFPFKPRLTRLFRFGLKYCVVFL